MAKRLSVLSFAAASAIAFTEAHASRWIVGDGTWQTSDNWQGGTPTSTVDATFDLFQYCNVALVGDATAANLNVTAGTVSLNFFGYTAAVGGTTTLAGSAATLNGGTLFTTSLNASAALTLSFNNGTIAINGGSYQPKQSNINNVIAPGVNDVYSNSFAVSSPAFSSARPVLTLINGGTMALTLPVGATGQSRGSIFVGMDGGKGGIAVSGVGSTLRTASTSGYLFVGNTGTLLGSFTASDGSLSLTQGGQASVTFSADFGVFGGKGVGTIDGAGSKLSANAVYVGAEQFGTLASQAGAGTVSVTNGGRVEAGFSTYIGSYGGVGSMTVAGVNANGTPSTLAATNGGLYVGYEHHANGLVGVGTLAVDDGGQVTSLNKSYVGLTGGIGRVTVSGVNANGTPSQLAVTGAGLAIGSGRVSAAVGGESEGTLTLTNGGLVTAQSLASIGETGGHGYVAVGKPDGTDTGNTRFTATDLNIGSTLNFADAGGSLFVYKNAAVQLNGNLVTFTNPAAANASNVTLAGGVINASAATFAASTSLNLTGGTLIVGTLNTSAGTLNFTDGTIVITGGQLAPTQTAVVLQSSPGGSGTYSSSFAVSGLASSASRPTVSLLAGGSVVLTATSNILSTSILIGINGGKGAGVVSGSGSALKTSSTAGLFYVGAGGTLNGSAFSAGDGSLSLSAGGQAGSRLDGYIGIAGGTGAVTVDGANSTLFSSAGAVNVGYSRFSAAVGQQANGSLAVTNGGQVNSAAGLTVGLFGGTGRVSVDGATSTVTVTSLVNVGNDRFSAAAGMGGDGSLSITGGAKVTSGGVAAGAFGGTGRISVSGAASAISSAAGAVSIGYDRYGSSAANPPGEGTLTLADGAAASFPAGSAVVGYAGGRGYVAVGKSDGTDTGNTRLTVGSLSIGSLVSATATADAGGILTVYSGGTVQLTGGVFTYANTANANATQINVAGGMLSSGSIANAASISISAGTLATGVIGGTGSLSATGGVLNATSLSQTRLAILGTASVDLANATASSAASVVGTVSFAGTGKLDLSNNTLVVTYSGSSPYANVRSAAAAGYNGGLWNGTGLTSQTSTFNRAVAVVEATDLYTTFPQTFAGVSVDNTTVIAFSTLGGDANLDRAVTSVDFNALASHYGSASGRWTFGDFNYDNAVDTRDFAALVASFGKTFTFADELPGTLPGAVVPEPAALGVIVGAGVVVRRRRRR